MSVLYRKYRPQTFGEVVGQNHIKVTLGNEIAEETVAHAYLFVGPRGTGKTTLARLLARAINCERRKPGTYEPCNECESCKLIKADRSLDIMEIDAATHTQVDNVRDNIVAATRIPPISKKGYKVFIVDEIHMLSKHAFNALLKTIEEPPARVVFILATTDVYKVPETIISRCQRFDFKKIPQQLIIDRLLDICVREGITVPKATLATIARKSEGCLRDAESLLGQVITMAENGVVTEDAASLVLPPSNWQHVETLVEFLHQKNLPGSLEFIHMLVEDGMDLESFVADIIEYLRQMLLKKTIGPGFKPDFDEQTVKKLNDLTNVFDLNELKRLLDLVLRESYRGRLSSIPQLPLELTCVEFCLDEFQSRPSIRAEQPGSPNTSDTAAVSTHSLVALQREWSALLAALKDYNHSLSVFLKVGHPLALTNDHLTIGFKYDFHSNTVLEKKNKMAVEEALRKIINRPISIDCVVDPAYTVNHKNFNGETDQEVRDVLDVIGGEVV